MSESCLLILVAWTGWVHLLFRCKTRLLDNSINHTANSLAKSSSKTSENLNSIVYNYFSCIQTLGFIPVLIKVHHFPCKIRRFQYVDRGDLLQVATHVHEYVISHMFKIKHHGIFYQGSANMICNAWSILADNIWRVTTNLYHLSVFDWRKYCAPEMACQSDQIW